MKYIRPDCVTKLPIKGGGELVLSAGYDTVHLFQPLGAAMLKYWDPENSKMCNVLMDLDKALLLSKMGELAVVERPFILVSEHDSLVDWRASNLTEGEFGL